VVKEMNKLTLIIARHGKSSSAIGVSDFKRGLTDRGVKQAKHVGESLKKMLGSIDLVISSDAIRARDTAQIISAELDYPIDEIKLESSLYHSDIENTLFVLKKLKLSTRIVLLVGHNPTWCDLVNFLQSKFFNGLRTSDVAVLKFEIPDWESIRPMSGELLYSGRFEENIK